MTADKQQTQTRSTRAKRTGTHKCPICKTETSQENDMFPFCSKRCRQIDLGKWLGGDYTISRPVEQSDLEEGE